MSGDFVWMGLGSMCVPVFYRKKVIDGVTEKMYFWWLG